MGKTLYLTEEEKVVFDHLADHHFDDAPVPLPLPPGSAACLLSLAEMGVVELVDSMHGKTYALTTLGWRSRKNIEIYY